MASAPPSWAMARPGHRGSGVSPFADGFRPAEPLAAPAVAGGRLCVARGTTPKLAADAGDRDLYVSIGLVPRRLGRADLDLVEADLAQASVARAGAGTRVAGASMRRRASWSSWRPAAAASASPRASRSSAGPRTSSRRSRSIAACRSIPIRSGSRPGRAEGIRSNMRAVFEAVAHRNSYPARAVRRATAGTSMVLKALFVGAPLGSDPGARMNAPTRPSRASSATTRTSAGSAGRPVSPSCGAASALRRSIRCCRAAGACSPRATPRERQAAALALAASPRPRSCGRRCRPRRPRPTSALTGSLARRPHLGGGRRGLAREARRPAMMFIDPHTHMIVAHDRRLRGDGRAPASSP